MNVLRWLIPAFLLLVLVVAAVLPATGPGRGWLLGQVATQLERQGYSLQYQDSAGNAWRGVTVEDARVQGPGVDVSTDSLTVEYSLTGLLRRELPLSVEVAGVRGSVSPEELQLPAGGGGGGGISVDLRDLDVRDVAVDVDGIPWTIPNLAIEDVAVSQRAGRTEFEATVRNHHGRALIEGSAAFSPTWEVELDVERADATLARHWWDHVEAGLLHGSLQASAESGVVSRLRLEDAAIEFEGAVVTGISGPVEMNGDVISAQLTAQGLGGPLAADVTVDIGEAEWRARVTGNPLLEELADWGARGSFHSESIDLTGTTEVEVEASGWETFTIAGNASGRGSVLTYPIDDLLGSFTYSSAEGVTAQATGLVAGGPLRVDVTPADGGMAIAASLDEAQLLPVVAGGAAPAADSPTAVLGRANLQLTSGPSGISGPLTANAAGTLAGRAVEVSVQGSFDGGDLMVELSGSDELGAAITGRATLRDGNLAGDAQVADLVFPGRLEGLLVDATFAGPVGELPIDLTFTLPVEEGDLTLAGFSLEDPGTDLTPAGEGAGLVGTARMVLSGSRLNAVEGRLGPIDIAGELGFSPLAGEFTYEVTPTGLGGLAHIDIAGATGALQVTAAGVNGSGTVELAGASAAGGEVELEAMTVDFELSTAADALLRFRGSPVSGAAEPEPVVSGSWQDGELTVELAEPPLLLAGEPLTVAGTLSGPELAASLSARSQGFEAIVEPAGEAHDITVSVREGFEFGPVTLQEPLAGEGRIGADMSGQVRGSFAGTTWQVRLQQRENGPRLEASLGSGEESLELAFVPASGNLFARGALDLTDVAAALGLPAGIGLSGSITRSDGSFGGEMQLQGEVAGVPVAPRIVGAGETLQLSGRADTFGVTWELGGTLLPELAVQAQSEHGRVTFDGDRIAGEGVLPRQLALLELPATGWQAAGSLSESSVQVTTGSDEAPRSQAVFTWSETPRLTARVNEEFTASLGGQLPVALDAELRWTSGGDGDIGGTVRLADRTFDLSGDLESIALSGEGVRARAANTESGWAFDATADDLEASYLNGRLALTADQASLGAVASLLGVALPAEAVVDGELSFDEAAGWQGALELFAGEDHLSVALTGAGSELAVEANAAVQGAVAGFGGALTGFPAAPSMSGQLATETFEAGPLTVPAVALDVEANFADGLLVSLQGEQANVQLTSAGLAGGVDLEILLDGQPHRINGTLAGDLNRPQLDVQVSGATVAGPVRFAGADGTGSLAVDPGAWLPDALTLPAAANLEFASSGAEWTAAIDALVAVGGMEFEARADLTGSGLSYDGTLTALTGAGTILQANVSGAGADLSAAADLAATTPAAVDALVPVETDLQPGGTVTVSYDSTTGTLATAVDARVEGTLAGQSASLAVTGDPLENLSVSGSVADLQLTSQLALTGVRFRLTSAEDTGTDLSGSLTWDEALDLAVSGLLAGEEISASGRFDPPSASGELVAETPFGDLVASATEEGGSTAIQGRFRASEGGPLPTGFAVDFTGAFAAERLLLHTLTAGVDGEQPLLELSGEVYPELALAGTASVTALPEPFTADLSVTTEGGSPVVTVAARGLELVGTLAAGIPQVALAGSGDLSGMVVDSNLTWNAEDGFSGTASLESPVAETANGPLLLTVTATGSGGLDARASLQAGASQLGGATVSLAARPWEDGVVRGEFNLDASAADFLSDYAGEPQVLNASGTLLGTITQPRLEGTLALGGALDAQGEFGFHDGAGSLDLRGDQLTATVETSADGIQARTELDLALASLPLPVELRGTAAGWLELEAEDLSSLLTATLRGSLQLEGAGLAADGAHLSGLVEVAGGANDPRVTLDLQAGGTASGTLQANLLPAQELLELQSDLRWGDLALVADARAAGGDLQANGRLELPGGSFAIATGPLPASLAATGSGFLLTGDGSFEGWQAAVDPLALALWAAGDVSTLAPAAQGRFDLNARFGGQEPWLAGTLKDLAVGGVQLGDVQLTADEVGSPVTVSGPALAGSIDPFAGLAWNLERLAVPLTPDLQLAGRAAGQGATGTAELHLQGTLMGESVELPVSVARPDDSALSLAAGGELLGGSLQLAAELAGGAWQGTLELEGAALAGFELGANGTISGETTNPVLEASLLVDGEELRAEGNVTLSPAAQQAHLVLQSPQLDVPVHVEASSAGGGRLQLTGIAGETLTVDLSGGAPAVAGGVSVPLGPALVSLAARPASGGEIAVGADPGQATSGGLALTVKLPELPGFGLTTAFSADDLASPQALLERPLTFTGTEATEGTLTISLSPLAVTGDGLAYSNGDLRARLSGSVASGDSAGPLGLAGQLSGSLELLRPENLQLADVLEPGTQIPITVTLDGAGATLASSSDLGTVAVTYDQAAGTASADAELSLGGGTALVQLDFLPGEGPSGVIQADRFTFPLFPAAEPAVLNGSATITPQAISMNADIRSPTGTLRASGKLGLEGLLPAALAPLGSSERRAELRLGTLDLSALPAVAERVPYLSVPLSGFVQVNGNSLVGSLVAPNMTVATEEFPLSVDITGTLDRVNLSTVLAGSPITINIDAESLSAVANLERFPGHLLPQAVTGPSDYTAEVTGVTRLSLPWGGWDGLLVEVATEQVRLERSEVVTTGNVSLTLTGEGLQVNEARFSGAGQWSARGQLSADLLDFTLVAEEADLTPLLGLVPALARFGVGAQGSVTLDAQGTLDSPQAVVSMQDLDISVSGSTYRMRQGEVRLEDEALGVSALVTGVSPVTGEVAIEGGGQLDLVPLAISGASFSVTGSADIPWLGQVNDFEARITSTAEAPLWLEGSGLLGAPFTVSGSLVPLDVNLRGEDLRLRLPQLLLASAQVDTDVRLRWTDAAYLSGQLNVDEALFQLGIGSEVVSSAPETGEEAATAAEDVAERFVFDGLRVIAPGRVRFNENFGSAELSLNLLLGGNASQPTLAGTANAIRGSLQFSGRDFTIRSAVASFDPSRGILPVLELSAVTSFDTARVATQAGNVRFLAPAEGNRFDVALDFAGEVEPAPEQSPPFRLDLTPTLSSTAIIEVERADGLDSGPRPLTEVELLSLIALGRLELTNPLGGESGLAAAVAEGAIDTAVDLFFVSELQSALAEALGIDVVEIQTTALSSVLGRSRDDPFSVSLRLGGYLSDDVFASYRIGTFDAVRGLPGITNEVNFVYDLGPVEFDVAGRVNFLDRQGVSSTDTELSASLRYDLYGATGLEAGVDLSDERQQVRFGVTLRW